MTLTMCARLWEIAVPLIWSIALTAVSTAVSTPMARSVPGTSLYALRMELEMGGVPVGVTGVYPGGIKTNIARSVRSNLSTKDLGLDAERGWEKFERLFVTDADTAAKSILRGVQKNRRRVLVGRDARVIDGMARLLPGAYQALIKRSVRRSLG